MATEIIPSVLRGLALRDDRFSAANVVSTSFADKWIEAGPEPDQPVPTVRGYMQLEALGEITADAAYDVVAQKEGAAVGGEEGGRFRYQATGAASDAWIGHLGHNKAGPFEFVKYNNTDEATTDYRDSRGIRTPGHKAIVVYTNEEPGPAVIKLMCLVRSPTADTWSEYLIRETFRDTHADVLQLPAQDPGRGGRLLCFYRTQLTEGGTDYDTISMSYSDDEGETWTIGGQHIAGFRESYAFGVDYTERLRAVYHAGYITILVRLIGGGLGNRTVHLVSSDLGGSFDEVEVIEDAAATYSFGLHEPIVDALGRVVVFHDDLTGAGTRVSWSRKGSPYMRFQDDPSYGTLGPHVVSAVTFETLAACVDDEGFAQLFLRRQTPNRFEHRMYKINLDDMAVVLDSANRVEGTTTAIAHPIESGTDDSVYLTIDCLVPHKGGIIALGHPVANNGATDTSLIALYLGQYTSIDWAFQTFGMTSGGATNGICWFPIESPTTTTAWTTGGAPTYTQTSLGGRLSTVAASGYWWRAGGAGTPCVIYAKRKQDSGGSTGADDTAIYVQCADGTYTHRISVRFTTTQIYAYDNVAGAQIGATLTHAANAFREVLIIVEHTSDGLGLAVNGRCLVAARAPWAETWTIVANAVALGDAGAAGAANAVHWGNRTANTSQSTWGWFYSAIDACTVPTGWPAATLPNPSNLQGRAFSFRDLYLNALWRIRSRGSTAYRGDAWHLPTRHEHGVPVCHFEVSPNRDTEARTTTDTAQAIIRWQPEAGTATRLLGSSLVLGLFGCNFGTAYFEANDGATDTLATLSLRQDFTTMAYALDGNHVRPDTGTPHAGTRVLEIDELIGGYAVFDPAAAFGGPFVRRIKRSAGGVCKSTAGRREELLVEGSMAGIPATGTLDIRQPDIVCVMHNVTDDYTWYQLRIPAQQTAEDYFKLALVFVGVLVPFPKQYSRGRGLELEGNVEILQDDAGHRRFRERGAPRRAVTIQWTDLWKTHPLYAAIPDPDYIVAGGGYPGIGVVGDSSVVEGAIRRSAGGAEPVIYMPSVFTGAATRQYQGRRQLMLGNIVGGTSRQAPLGDENATESHTVSSVRVEELL